jgi:hypothetical protein
MVSFIIYPNLIVVCHGLKNFFCQNMAASGRFEELGKTPAIFDEPFRVLRLVSADMYFV